MFRLNGLIKILSTHSTVSLPFYRYPFDQVIDLICILGTINSRNKFHEWLLDFLKGPGISYQKDVWFTNVSGQLPKIKVTINIKHL